MNFLFTYIGFILADESLRKRMEMCQHLLWFCERKIHVGKKNYRRAGINNCVLHPSGQKAY